MRRIGIFGGSFNPPHAAHQLVALYALETQPVDELWFVPVYAHVFGKALAPFAHRVAMCELAAAALGPRAQVSRAEETLAQQPGFAGSRTLDLLELLVASHPDAQLRLVIGADILGDAPKWYRWDDVCALAPPIVIGRAGHALPPGAHATDVVMPMISATAVRARLAAGDDAGAASLLPGGVLRYIAEHQLYRSSS
jgi:nicotinate-nucleotide adenylyltransferase